MNDPTRTTALLMATAACGVFVAWTLAVAVAPDPVPVVPAVERLPDAWPCCAARAPFLAPESAVSGWIGGSWLEFSATWDERGARSWACPHGIWMRQSDGTWSLRVALASDPKRVLPIETPDPVMVVDTSSSFIRAVPAGEPVVDVVRLDGADPAEAIRAWVREHPELYVESFAPIVRGGETVAVVVLAREVL